MKKINKIIALVIASVMILGSLAGCGSKENADGPAATATAAPTAAPAGQDEATAAPDAEITGVEGYTAFANKVTLKIPVYDRGVEGVPDVSNNYWTGWLQENFGDKYNVELEFVSITRSDVMTDYSLLAAAGDLPTILMEYDYPKVTQWANDGYLTTFDMDEFAKVAPAYYNRMTENDQLQFSKVNGETYFALAYRPYYNTNYTYQYWVRMDWLKEVGYDHVPKTRAEYVDAMTKIMEAGLAEHPGGGTMITSSASDQNYKYRAYPLNEEEWAMDGDVSIASLGTEANKKLLKEANENYNLGITDPEYYITDEETAKAAFVNGKTYSYGGYIAANVDFLTSFYAQNPEAELAILPVDVVDEAGGTTPLYRMTNPFGMIIGFSSGATADEIKAAWMYMEWMTREDNLFTMQWGMEGENYTVDSTTGLPVSVAEYAGDKKQGFNNSKDYWCVTVEARTAGTIEDIIKVSSPQGLPQDFTKDITDMYYDQLDLYNQGYAVNDVLFSVPIAAESEYSGTLTELYKEYRDKLTMCKQEEFDALYDELSKAYLEAGYQAVRDERLQAYKDGHSTKLPDALKK